MVHSHYFQYEHSNAGQQLACVLVCPRSSGGTKIYEFPTKRGDVVLSICQEYYHLEHPAESGQVNPTIDMLLQWGAIMYLPGIILCIPSDIQSECNSHFIRQLMNQYTISIYPVAPIGAYILSYPITGLQTSVRTAVTLQIIYSLIRCLPSILDSIPFINYSISNNFWHTLVFLHSAQIIRGFAGILLFCVLTVLD